MKKIWDYIKKNKCSIILLLLTFVVLVFTHYNTYLANDDLAYLYLFRGGSRVTTIIDVIRNQLSDYIYINGRLFVHMVLQAVLIFDKNLWAIVNPLMIIISVLLIVKIARVKENKINEFTSILIALVLYFSLFKFKSIIYWVAGSVNYVWVFVLLLLFIYLIYKYSFNKHKLLNMLFILILCGIHECTMVFTIIFVLGNMVIDIYKNKKFNKIYLLYIMCFLSSLILFLSPANQARLVSDPEFSSLSLLGKMNLSIPIISRSIMDINNIYSIISLVFVIDILILLRKNKNIFSKIISLLILVDILLINIINNNWLYFILVLLLVVGEYYSHIKNKEYDLGILSLSMYGVVFSNIISPTYAAGRPNYYFYMYIILLTVIIINRYLKNKKEINIVTLILIILLSGLLVNEVIIYKNIGTYHMERLEQIEEFKKNPSDTLYLVKMPDKYNMYHMDINLPDKDWFNYRYFVQYYELPKDVTIIYKEESK